MSVWHGAIPSHWESQKVGELFTERREKVSDTEFAPLSVSKAGIVPQMANVAKSSDGENRKLVKRGDFAINSRSDRRGSSGVSEYDGSVSLINIVLTPRSETNERYWYYLLKSHIFIEEYYRSGRGIVADLWTTRYTEMKAVYLPVPPRQEQDKIVRYLDWKVSQINKLINAKKRQIGLLKEYIGANVDCIFRSATEKVTPLSRCTTKIGSGKTPRGGVAVYVESGVMFIRSQNVHPSGLVTETAYYITDDIDESMKSTRVYKGDVLLNITGGSLGRSCIYNLEEHANVNQHVCIIRPNQDLLVPEYLTYFLNSPLGQEVMTSSQNEGNRESLTFVQIGTFKIPLPAVEEQKKILTLVNSIAKPVETIIKQLNDEISYLSEYRARLLSDVVTGKLDVQGVTVPEYEVEAEVAVL